MTQKNVYAIYFSPTGNSKNYACALAQRLDANFTSIDFTNFETRHTTINFTADDLVIIAAPVYAGRLPNVPDGLFTYLQGNQTPAVVLVTYGNREFDDALLELKNTVQAQGFHCIGAGAFIGEHTFCSKAGANRPNEEDSRLLDQLADSVKNWDIEKKEPQIPGNYPYCDAKKMPFVPQPDASCQHCGACAKHCPTQVIDASGMPIHPDACIVCFACVKHCPLHARGIQAPEFGALVSHLENILLKEEKKARLF